MSQAIGVLAAEHLAVGFVEGNNLVGELTIEPRAGSPGDVLQGIPAESVAQNIAVLVSRVAKAQSASEPEAVGVGFPGIIRQGVIEDSPNLHQMKGFNLQTALVAALKALGIEGPVFISNDADAIAAGIAATRGHLDKFIRVWTLGNGIGFGHYPWEEGTWEGGHSVVSLDPKENLCGCGGKGHLEGIMGHRAMRLRFLDLEPEEIFANAKQGEPRCVEFVDLWHRALAAATATCIHMEGPGRFFVTGPNAHFVEITRLDLFLREMVMMSPLQGSFFEVIDTGDEIGVIGAAVNAERQKGL